MKKLLLIGLITSCLTLTGCPGMKEVELLASKPEMRFTANKTVNEYFQCIDPMWRSQIGYKKEVLGDNYIRLIATPNPKLVRFILDIKKGTNNDTEVTFYNATGTTFFLGDVIYPIKNCAY